MSSTLLTPITNNTSRAAVSDERSDSVALPVHEQETSIIFMRNSDMAVIYTSDSTTMTKLDKKVKSVNSEWKLKEVHRLQDTEEIIGKTYTCPKSLISFRTARKHCSSQNAF